MNPLALLKMLGINPDEVMGVVAEFGAKAERLEGRVASIEDKLERVIALLEGLHDEAATQTQEIAPGNYHTLTVVNGENHADN
jgi:hypothetical protein